MILTKRLNTADRGTLTAHLLALSSEDRRLRFGGAASNEILRDYVARIDFDRDAVFGFLADDLSLGGAAHVAIVDGVAELGVSVLAAYRRRGIASALFQRASDFARNHFIQTLFMRCLTENAAMMQIARKSGMKIVTGGGAADAHLPLPPPDVGPITTEFFQECLALLDFNLKAQVLALIRLQAAFTGRLVEPESAFMVRQRSGFAGLLLLPLQQTQCALSAAGGSRDPPAHASEGARVPVGWARD